MPRVQNTNHRLKLGVYYDHMMKVKSELYKFCFMHMSDTDADLTPERGR